MVKVDFLRILHTVMLKQVLSKMLRQLADDVDNDKFDCGEHEIVGIITQLAEFNTGFLSKA